MEYFFTNYHLAIEEAIIFIGFCMACMGQWDNGTGKFGIIQLKAYLHQPPLHLMIFCLWEKVSNLRKANAHRHSKSMFTSGSLKMCSIVHSLNNNFHVLVLPSVQECKKKKKS